MVRLSLPKPLVEYEYALLQHPPLTPLRRGNWQQHSVSIEALFSDIVDCSIGRGGFAFVAVQEQGCDIGHAKFFMSFNFAKK